jgi:hypothetical protein
VIIVKEETGGKLLLIVRRRIRTDMYARESSGFPQKPVLLLDR